MVVDDEPVDAVAASARRRGSAIVGELETQAASLADLERQLAAARETGAAAAGSPRAIRRRILWSCGLVAANYVYVLGAHLSDLPPGFCAYLALGAAYWPALGVWVARPLSGPANQERETELWFARHAGSAV